MLTQGHDNTDSTAIINVKTKYKGQKAVYGTMQLRTYYIQYYYWTHFKHEILWGQTLRVHSKNKKIHFNKLALISITRLQFKNRL